MAKTQNMFAQAKANAAEPKAKAKSKKDRDEVTVDSLNEYAAVDYVIKTLESLKETYKGEVTDQMMTYFVETGLRFKAQPKNFTGTDTNATASCQLRKRTSRSNLTPADTDTLDNLGISYDTVEDVTTTYIINAKYKDDEKLLGKVNVALSKIKDIPEDFIEMQVGQPRKVVTDVSVREAFDLTDAGDLESALNIVATFAIRPTYKDTMKKALDFIKSLVN